MKRKKRVVSVEKGSVMEVLEEASRRMPYISESLAHVTYKMVRGLFNELLKGKEFYEEELEAIEWFEIFLATNVTLEVLVCVAGTLMDLTEKEEKDRQEEMAELKEELINCLRQKLGTAFMDKLDAIQPKFDPELN